MWVNVLVRDFAGDFQGTGSQPTIFLRAQFFQPYPMVSLVALI